MNTTGQNAQTSYIIAKGNAHTSANIFQWGQSTKAPCLPCKTQQMHGSCKGFSEDLCVCLCSHCRLTRMAICIPPSKQTSSNADYKLRCSVHSDDSQPPWKISIVYCLPAVQTGTKWYVTCNAVPYSDWSKLSDRSVVHICNQPPSSQVQVFSGSIIAIKNKRIPVPSIAVTLFL